MATITPIEPAWLARTFVEFESLPDLLLLSGTAAADAPPESWTAWEFWDECNIEHIEEEGMPADEDLRDFLVADAWQLVRRLQLVLGDGLSSAGWSIAGIAETPLDLRIETGQLPNVFTVLAEQVNACHLGRDDLVINDLLQRGARHLAETAHPWAGYCPGLLLVEFDALVRLADTDPDRAQLLIAELVANRASAMRAYDTPSPDVTPIDNMVIHADAVTAYYLDDLRLLPDDTLNISAARATAMLYTFSGLLREANPIGPVHCLAPMTDGK